MNNLLLYVGISVVRASLPAIKELLLDVFGAAGELASMEMLALITVGLPGPVPCVKRGPAKEKSKGAL